MRDFGVNILYRTNEFSILPPSSNKEFIIPYVIENNYEAANFDDRKIGFPEGMIRTATLAAGFVSKLNECEIFTTNSVNLIERVSNTTKNATYHLIMFVIAF